MTTTTIRGGYATWADSANPSTRHPNATYLHLKSGAQDAMVYLKNPAPRGTTVLSATLRIPARLASTGARTLTARPLSGNWQVATSNWNNRPPATTPISSATVGTLADGDWVEFDVTAWLQAVVNGAKHYGWRIGTTATTAHFLYGWGGGQHPELVVEFAYKPSKPSNLSPAGGSVALSKPTLQFDFNDLSGKVHLNALRVQIDPAANATAPAFDSGTVNTSQPQLDLTTTAYAGLANGATTKWRVQVKDTDGLWSDWSNWVSFTRTDKATLTLLNPAASPNDFVTEPTPPIIWSFATQAAYRVYITPAADRSKLWYDSGKKSGTDQSLTIPKDIIKVAGGRYSVGVKVFDSVPRVVTPGDPGYTMVWRDFTFSYDATPNPVTGLEVTRPDEAPRQRLMWSRPNAPDSYVIERDGVVIASKVDPADTLLTGTLNTYDDWTSTPWADHTYYVRPVENGKVGSRGAGAIGSWRASSVFLADPERGYWFTILDAQWSDLSFGEDYTATNVAGQSINVKLESMRGIEGTLTGVLTENDWDPRTLDEQLVDVYAIKGRPLSNYRLIVGDVNIPVIVRGLSPGLSADTTESIPVRALSMSVWQNGELPYTVTLK